MKVSVVVTVKNDERGVKKLRLALSWQTKKPDEVIIVRAAPAVRSPLPWSSSTRRGVTTAGFGLTNEFFQNKNSGSSEKTEKWQKTVFAGMDCSRGKGRNIGVRMAKNNVIVVTDVGCTPHRDWLERLIVPIEHALRQRSYRPDVSSGLQDDGGALVVAGFYRVVATTPFQQAVAPYLAVFPDQWTNRYLPASRSIAFTKRAWELVGGYPEKAKSGAEDLVFAARLAKHRDITIIHAPDALVDWEPPATVPAFFRDMVKHTKGNLETHYWPHLVKNYSVLFRWVVFLLIPWLIPLYLLWPIVKHRSRVGLRAMLWLPVVQVIADAGVIYVFFTSS